MQGLSAVNFQKKRSLPPGLAEVVRRRKRRIVIVPPVVLLGLGIVVLFWVKGIRPPISSPKGGPMEEVVVTETGEGAGGPSGIQEVSKPPEPSVSEVPQVPLVERDVPQESHRQVEPKGKETSGSKTEEADGGKGSPSQGLEHLWLARSYEQRGEYGKAIGEYLAFLQLREDPKVLNRVAVLYLKVDNLQEAERFLKRALSLSPDNLGFLINYAVVLAKQGSTARAEEVLMKVLERDPNNPDALFNLALLMEKEGNLEGARELYRRLSLLGDPSGREGLRRLGLRR